MMGKMVHSQLLRTDRAAWRCQRPGFHGGSKNFSLSRLLNENNEAQIVRVQSGWELRLEVKSEIAPLLKFAYFLHFHHNGNVSQLPSTIFAAKYLCLSPVQGNGAINIPAMFLEFIADFQMRAKNGWGSSFHAERADRYGDRRGGSGSLEHVLDLLGIVEVQFACAVYYGLRGIGRIEAEFTNISILAFGH